MKNLGDVAWSLGVVVVGLGCLAWQAASLVQRQTGSSSELRVTHNAPEQVSPGQRCHFTVTLTNIGDRKIELAPPLGDCSCLVLSQDAVVIPGNASDKLQVIYSAAGRPGIYRRRVVLRNRKGSILRTIPFTFQVSGALWAEPAKVNIRYDPARMPPAPREFVVHHAPSARPLQVSSKSEWLSSATKRSSESSTVVQVKLLARQASEAPPVGKSLVRVRDTAEKQALDVAVEWRPKEIGSFVPSSVWVNKGMRAASMDIFFFPDTQLIQGKGAKFESLVPWLSIDRQQWMEGVWGISCRIDSERIPASHKSSEILRVTTPGRHMTLTARSLEN